MPKFLPLFPLQLVVFPGEKLKLHIFEPRYKQLIGECRDEKGTFGIPAYIDNRVAEYGTEMRLLQIFATHPGGEMDILTEGVSVFHLERFERQAQNKLYPGGHVTPLDIDTAAYPVTMEELAQQYAKFHELLKTGYTRERFDIRNISYQLAQEVGLSLVQKVQMLAIAKETDRQLFLIQHLHRIIPMLEGAEDTRRRVKGNGHFAKLPPINL